MTSSYGSGDFSEGALWFSPTIASNENSCLVVYSPATHTLALLNDAGTDWTAAAIGMGPAPENSQCAVNTFAAGASPTGNTWMVTVPLTFTPTFAGVKNIYLKAESHAGPSTGWQDRGDWGASCTYSVSPSSQTVGAAPGSLQVSVTTTAGCPWTAPASSGFLSLSGGGGTAGSGSATYSFGSHSGDPRSTQVTVAGAAVSVMQTGSVPGASEQVLYYHTDAIGSVRVLTDANGQIYPNAQTRYDYLPYGVLWLEPLHKESRLFTGQERDNETSLDYFGARYLHSSTGRFTSVDPGHVGGYVLESQSWNGYPYAGNNPLRFTDPSGTDYLISVDGGTPFWFDEGYGDFKGLKRYLLDQGFSAMGWPEGGYILNAAGQPVGEYTYSERFARVFGDAGRMADASVRYSASVVVSNFLGSGVAVGLRWGTEALIIAAEARAARMVAAASAKRGIAGVLKQIAQGTTKGKIFNNRDGLLPIRPIGYYREYTVLSAGHAGRAAARLVRGANGEIYYTADHYATFVKIP